MAPSQELAGSPKSKSNEVTIDDKAKTIVGISYVGNSLVITPEQPAQTPQVPAPVNNVWKITLEAGRKRSKGVAVAFNSDCGGKSKVYSKGQSDKPEELNFYFAVDITFADGATEKIYLGQGSHGSVNNWWIGGKAIFREDIPRLEYRKGDEIVTDKISGTNDRFKLEEADKRRPDRRVEHVFVLMLENHSFDNMLALSKIPGIEAATHLDCNSYVDTRENPPTEHTYCFKAGAPDSMSTDPGHEFPDVLEQLAGVDAVYHRDGDYPPIDNSGFVANYATSKTEGHPPNKDKVHQIMRGFDTKEQLPALYALAKNFAVCDHWFSSLPGPTWPNRFFLHGASSSGLDHSPTFDEYDKWLPVPKDSKKGFRFRHGSIFDRMKEHSITWGLFHDKTGLPGGDIPLVAFIRNLQFKDVHPLADPFAETDFEREMQKASYPYQYTFIEPNYGDWLTSREDWRDGSYKGGSSQHPMDSVVRGDALICHVYETIRKSKIWEKSLLIITYDEHGGFYDHVAPPEAKPPGDGPPEPGNSQYGFNFKRYGVRVPAVVISPYIQRQVEKTIYDHTSVLATLEKLFGLDPLTERDKYANDFLHLLSHNLRTDAPNLQCPAMTASVPQLSPAEQAANDLKAIPDGTTATGMLAVLLKTDIEMRGSAVARARFALVKTRGDARAYTKEVIERVDAVRATKGEK
jgi:phospholipase C